MKQQLYRRAALALAVCALAGTAVAQSSPSSTTPMNNPSTTPTTPHSGTPPTMAPGGQPMTGSPGMSSTSRMPSRTDSVDNAYRSLDPSNRGYLSKTDVQGLNGFNFDQADTNRDGRLSKDEFAKAWGATK